jgi:hypothetical protein
VSWVLRLYDDEEREIAVVTADPKSVEIPDDLDDRVALGGEIQGLLKNRIGGDYSTATIDGQKISFGGISSPPISPKELLEKVRDEVSDPRVASATLADE